MEREVTQKVRILIKATRIIIGGSYYMAMNRRKKSIRIKNIGAWLAVAFLILCLLAYSKSIAYRTDMNGDILCRWDGQDITFEVEKNKDGDAYTYALPTPTPSPTPAPTPSPATVSPQQAQPVGQDYVLNTHTKKFHYPSCGSVKKMKEKNKSYFTGTREEVLARGYSPCGNCHP